MSKYKNLIKKIKPPTWRKINSEESVPNDVHRKGNNELKKLIEGYGYSIWDHWHLMEEGYQISARKACPELALNRNPYLNFRWVWMDEFSQYWRATLTASFDYFPEDKFMHPWGFYEIMDITKTTIHHLPTLEKRVIDALKSQSIISNEETHIRRG